MATSLTATVSASISWTFSNALTGSINTVNSNQWSYSKSTTNGTGAAGTADLIYAAAGTIAASATLNLDFAGSLASFFGTTITMARMKFLFLHHTTDTTATSLTIGNHANPLALTSGTDTISLRNGGILLFGDSGGTGIAITGGATDALKIVNADGANTATYNVCAIGGSA